MLVGFHSPKLLSFITQATSAPSPHVIRTVTSGLSPPATHAVTSGPSPPTIHAVTSGPSPPAIHAVTSGLSPPAIHAVISGLSPPASHAVDSIDQKGFMSIELHFLVSHNFHTDICLEAFTDFPNAFTISLAISFAISFSIASHLRSHFQSHPICAPTISFAISLAISLAISFSIASHLRSHFQSHPICALIFNRISFALSQSRSRALNILHITHSDRKQTARNSHSHISRSTSAMFCLSPVRYYLCAFLITCLQVLVSTKNSVRYHLLRVSDYLLGSDSFLRRIYVLSSPLAVRGTISAYDFGEARLRDSMVASPLRRLGS
jgi:hypothetical protein